MGSGLVRVGGFLSILAASFIISSVVIELISGVPFQTLNQFGNLDGFILYSFDWGGVAIEKLTSYSFLILGLFLLIPVYVSLSEFLNPGKGTARLLISLLLLIPILLLVNAFYHIFDFTVYASLPVSETTPAAAIPGIVHSQSGILALVMISTAVYAPLVFTFSFGVQARRARKAEISQPVKGLGYISTMMGLSWLLFLIPDMFSILGFYLTELSLLVFSLWILSLGISMLKVEFSPSPGFWKVSSFGAVISGAVLVCAAFLGLMIDLSDPVAQSPSSFLGDWGSAASIGMVFLILGSVGVIMAFAAAQGVIQLFSQREGLLRHVPLIGLLGGMTVLLSVFVLTNVTIWFSAIAERSVYDWNLRMWIIEITPIYANSIRVAAVSGFLVVTIPGVLLASLNVLKSDAPKAAGRIVLALGLAGAGTLVGLLIEPLIIFPSLSTFLSLVVLSVWLIVMGAISQRYGSRNEIIDFSQETTLNDSQH